MSLINKMLQDLDARRGQSGGVPGNAYRPQAASERRSRSAMVIGLVSALSVFVVAAGAFAAWRFYQKREAPRPPAVTFVNAAAPAPVQRIAPPVVAPVAAPPAVVAAAPAPVGQAAPVRTEPAATQDGTEQQPPRKAAARTEPRKKPVARETAAATTPSAAVPVQGAQTAPGRVMSTRQNAEAEYRRATVALQEGRVRDAIKLLEDALEADPRHDAARQTLVGLLVEARRGQDAMQVLQSGLTLDPRQPAMAMLLARLQIEHGGNGIDTLMRTLPYASGNADYHGFLAGALQRSQRHREAVEQYQAAVRAAPGNGVWWMGLGISLQAEKRAPEAAEAYSRALGTGALSQELRTFVERRLEQSRR